MKGDVEAELLRVRQELQAAEKRVLHAERHAALARLSGALAHELRNPLHIVRGLAETAGRRAPEIASYADDIKAEVDRIEMLIAQLLQFARPLDLAREETRILDLLHDACDRVVRARKDRGKPSGELSVSCESQTVPVDPMLFGQAIENLVDNGLDAAGGAGRVAIREEGEESSCVITIHDSGPGMAGDDLRHAFEPFFTRKLGGTGLGLSFAQRVVELHGGELVIGNHVEGGLVATIRLSTRGG